MDREWESLAGRELTADEAEAVAVILVTDGDSKGSSLPDLIDAPTLDGPASSVRSGRSS